MHQILEMLREKYNIVLDGWQKEIFEAEDRYMCIVSGRQVGKTTTIAAKVCKFALENPKKKVLIISRTQKQSGYLFDLVKQMLYELDIKFPDDPTQTKAILSNQATIYSLPSGWTGASLRFLTTDLLIVEEAAYIPDDVYTAVRPQLATTKGQTIMFSTPNGPQGFFYHCFHDSLFRTWKVSSEDCWRIPKDFLSSEKKRMSKVEYQREYMGLFTHVQDGLIDIDLIQERMIHRQCNKKTIHFIGVDVARFGKDDSVVAFCEYDYNTKKAHICRVDVIKGKKRTTHLEGVITQIKTEYGVSIKKIIVDETGIGSGPVDHLVERFGKRLILGINNASKGIEEVSEGRRRHIIKEDLYSNLIRLLEKEDLSLDDDINILRSLRNVRFEYTSKGNLKIFGPDHDVAEAIVRSVFPLLYHRPKKIFLESIKHSNREDNMFIKEIDVYG